MDEYDYASQKRIRSFRMPANSGPVYSVKSMPNGKQIVWYVYEYVYIYEADSFLPFY